MFAVAQSTVDFAIGCTFFSLFLVAAFIDIDRMEIYDAMVIGGVLAGIILPLLSPSWHGEQSAPMALFDSLCGMCFGSGLMFWIAAFGEMAFKREAIGGGDVKLMGMVGAFIGWKGCLFAVFGGCLLSSMAVLPLLFAWKILHWKDFKLPSEIPFVPFLAVGGIAYVLLGQNLLNLLF
jgi:leader peptidase (prepilin peptidase)/N-methyltransferase